MKYFTPELYARFNSEDPTTEAAAEEQWEQAITDYRRRLQEIASKLPAEAREFAQTVSLHDADYLGHASFRSSPTNASITQLLVQRNDDYVLLMYTSGREPSVSPAPADWKFSPEEVHWLYDEVDLDAVGCSHEILLSNGRTLTIPFEHFHVATLTTAHSALT